MKDRYTTCVLANMCMIEDDKGNVLVQERLKKDWPGITFPGGHVEKGETLEESVIREVREETGLIISHPVFCGIKEWEFEEGVRYLGLLYKVKHFQGTILSSSEGKVFWIKKKDLFSYQTSQDLDVLFQMMEAVPYPKEEREQSTVIE